MGSRMRAGQPGLSLGKAGIIAIRGEEKEAPRRGQKLRQEVLPDPFRKRIPLFPIGNTLAGSVGTIVVTVILSAVPHDIVGETG